MSTNIFYVVLKLQVCSLFCSLFLVCSVLIYFMYIQVCSLFCSLFQVHSVLLSSYEY